MTPEEQEAWAVVADMEHDIGLMVEESDKLRAEIERLRAALEASHAHAYAKPGCAACEVLGTPIDG